MGKHLDLMVVVEMCVSQLVNSSVAVSLVPGTFGRLGD